MGALQGAHDGGFKKNEKNRSDQITLDTPVIFSNRKCKSYKKFRIYTENRNNRSKTYVILVYIRNTYLN